MVLRTPSSDMPCLTLTMLQPKSLRKASRPSRGSSRRIVGRELDGLWLNSDRERCQLSYESYLLGLSDGWALLFEVSTALFALKPVFRKSL